MTSSARSSSVCGTVSRLLNKSLAFGDEARVVAFMDEDVTDEAVCGAQGDPAATAGGAAVVEALPRELSAGGTVARAIAHIEIGFDGEKRQFAAVLAGKGDVRVAEQVDLVPLVHFGDPPAPGKGAGEARRAPGHLGTPISFGSRTRL